VEGHIASEGDAEFSERVTKDRDVNTVQFSVDGKTKVEGKLAARAQATVEYRSDEGKNIAVRVIATPASGMNLFSCSREIYRSYSISQSPTIEFAMRPPA